MSSNDLQAAINQYKSGDKVAAFQSFMGLSMSGDATAEYWAAMVCQENMMLFLASDLWNDLLVHQAEPREGIAKEAYEILMWQGRLREARSFIKRERFNQLKDDIESRDYVSNSEEMTRQVATFANALSKLDVDEYPTTKFNDALKQLELKSNLGTISSQLYYEGKTLGENQTMIVRGDDVFGLDLEEYVSDAEAIWEEVRDDAARLLGDLSQSKSPSESLRQSIADLGQQALERLFFIKGSMSLETTLEKNCATNIGIALRQSRPVASVYYLALAQA